MRIKVCGITTEDQLQELATTGAEFAGLIFYPKSPRYVLRHMTTMQIRKQQAVNKVGVFVNASAEEILLQVDECRLHMVQLHGDESPRFCERIADYISVVKVFRIGAGDPIRFRIQDYMNVCDMFMFDTEGAGYGGTGQKIDPNWLSGQTIGKPYLLSGGLDMSDAATLNAFADTPEGRGLFAVDINTAFEVAPGIKDLEKIGQFKKQFRS